MECSKCFDTDLCLIEYTEVEAVFGIYYETSFECRQCGNIFNAELSENELNQYR